MVMKNTFEDWTDLCPLSDVPPAGEGGKYITVRGYILAVWRLENGTVRVTDDRCPHAGGSLSAGHVDAESNCIICPWHAWPFDVQDGTCPDNRAIAVRTYESRIRDGRIFVKLS